jgi:hypothetical protein
VPYQKKKKKLTTDTVKSERDCNKTMCRETSMPRLR